jgi:hypothetical protein
MEDNAWVEGEGVEDEGEEVEAGEGEGEEADRGCRIGPVTTEAVGGLAREMAPKTSPCALTSLQLAGSTNKLCFFKKSTPKIGKSTAASKKGQVKSRPWNRRHNTRSPQHLIG